MSNRKDEELLSRILLAIYATIIDPELYWSVVDYIDSMYSDENRDLTEKIIEPHAGQLVRLSNKARAENGGINSGIDDELPDLIIRDDGRVEVRGAAKHTHFLNGVDLSHYSNLPCYPEDIDRIDLFIKSNGEVPSLIVGINDLNSNGNALAKVNFSVDKESIELRLVHNTIKNELYTEFSENFNVTKTEFRILQLLVRGENVKSISSLNNRSIQTVRTQVRSLLRKLYVDSQSSLIARSLAVSSNMEISSNLEIAQRKIIFKGNHKIEYFVFGREGGSCVLLFHSAIEGPLISNNFDSCLKARNIKLMSLSRPGCGLTTKHNNRDFVSYLEKICDLYQEILSHESVTKYSIATISSGLPYALEFIRKRRSSPCRIVALNPLPPFDDRRLFPSLPGRWKKFAFLVHHSPKMVGALTALAVNYKFSNSRQLAEGVLRDDIRKEIPTALQEDLVETLSKNYELMSPNASDNYQLDANFYRTSWDKKYAETTSINTKIQLIQGRGHFRIPFQHIKALSDNLVVSQVTQLEEDVDPIHLLNPQILCELIGE
ncbi:MAG: LuxR C-terminal-related transcriptional regulator [Hyphomicrobiales bacterium]